MLVLKLTCAFIVTRQFLTPYRNVAGCKPFFATVTPGNKESVLVTVCLASSTVIASAILDKPYYDVKDAETLFADFVKEYKRSYNRKDYFERLEIFKNNLVDINLRNARHPQTVFAVNRFTDLRPEERQLYLGFRPSNDIIEKVTIPDSSKPAPDKLNYTAEGVVAHVKDQGDCGSCYIFSAVGNIEGQYALKHNECIALSEAQCLDCLDSGSCGGGIMHEVMQELGNKSGIVRESDYQYKPVKWLCKEKGKKVIANVKGGKVIDIPDEDVLKQKLADIGPLAVAIDAADFWDYKKGILHPQDCHNNNITHGVLLVGYGEEDGTKFWIIKNSWGVGWGEQGYVRLLRGVNACGMGVDYTATADVE